MSRFLAALQLNQIPRSSEHHRRLSMIMERQNGAVLRRVRHHRWALPQAYSAARFHLLCRLVSRRGFYKDRTGWQIHPPASENLTGASV